MRMVVVSSGNVAVAVLPAEPTYTAPGYRVVPSVWADVGDIYDPATGLFVRGPAAPAYPPASTGSSVKTVFTRKSDLWRRATPEEAQTMSADLQDAEAQLRELYLAVQYLDHAAPEFSILRAAIVARFGEARADQLLAPSEE